MKLPNNFLGVDGESALRRILDSDNPNDNLRPLVPLVSSEFSLENLTDF